MGHYKLLFAIILMALIGQSTVSAADRKLVKAVPASIKSAVKSTDRSDVEMLERIEVSIPAGQSRNFNRKVTGGTIFSYECTYSCPSFMTFEDLDVYRDDLNRVNVEFSISVAADAPIGIYNVDISYYFYDVNGEYVKDVLYEYAVNTEVPPVNHSPVLSNPSMSPMSGLFDASTNFHFSVIYTDEDGDPPTQIWLLLGFIDDDPFWSKEMVAGTGDYKTGKEYYLDVAGNTFGEGVRRHQFYATDGKPSSTPAYIPSETTYYDGPTAYYNIPDFTATPTSGTAPLNVQFTDKTTGNVNSWDWDFGDGTTAYDQNPVHQYSSPGKYTVSLKATGNIYSYTKTIENFISVQSAPAPTVDFTATPTSGTTPLAVQFTSQTTGSITSYAWNFGDGYTSSQTNPNHTYTTAGSWTVALTVTSPGGSATRTRNSYITTTVPIPVPTADFTATPTSGTTPLAVQFTSQTTGSITSYAWNFGDGSTSSQTNPNHTYTTAGSWTVALTVTSPGGSATRTRNSYITTTVPIPVPTADFTATPTSGTTPLAVQFTSQTTGSITSYAWNFGDGSTSSQTNPNHTYTTAGSWTVALTVTGPGGSATRTRNSYITTTAPIPAPTADFTATPTSGTTPLAVQFTSQTTGSITSYAWNFGDGSTSTQANPSHTYTAAGVWTVKLTVTGPGGSNTKTRSSYITTTDPVPLPTVDFTATPTTGTTPLVVQFTSQTTGSITSYAWNFGDGSTSTQANPSHTYTTAGSWTVTLTVTGPGGTANKSKSNYITTQVPAPTADFTATPTSGTTPLAVQFTSQTTGSITSYTWDFGDSFTSSLANPIHTYTSAGTWSVKLTVTGPGGSNTKTRSGYVTTTEPVPLPTADFTATPTSGTTPLAVQFTSQTTGSVTSYDWNFGDGATSTLANPIHTYTTAGIWTVTLTVTGPGGTTTNTRHDLITVNPVIHYVRTNEWVSFYGENSYFQKIPLPIGSVIKVYDPQGIQCGQSTVSQQGQFGFISVYRDDFLTADIDEGAVPGDTIRFSIDDIDAIVYQGHAVWTEHGDIIKVELLTNRAPTMLRTFDDIEIDEDTPRTAIANLDSFFVDSDEDPLDYSVKTDSAQLFTQVTADHHLLIQTLPNVSGQVTLILVAADNYSSIADTFLVKIKPVNDPPEISAIPDTTFINTSALMLDLNRYVRDAEEEPYLLTWSSQIQPVKSDSVKCTIDDNNLATLRSAHSFIGNVWVIFTVSDSCNATASDTVNVYVDYIVAVEPTISPTLPNQYSLQTNYPNPFNPATTIRFGVPRDTQVQVVIYNLKGQKVCTLADALFTTGWHELLWNGLDVNGQQAGTGIYVVRMVSGKTSLMQKISLIR